MKRLVERWASKKQGQWNIQLICRDTVQKILCVEDGVRHERTTNETCETQNNCPSADQLSARPGGSYSILLSWSAS